MRGSRRRCQTGRYVGTPFPIDCYNLAQLVLRRCEGCTPQVHLETAARFLDAQRYPHRVQERVLALLQEHLGKPTAPSTLPMPPKTRVPLGGARPRWSRAEGTTICSSCRQRFYDHPRLKKFPWLTQLCNGELVKLD